MLEFSRILFLIVEIGERITGLSGKVLNCGCVPFVETLLSSIVPFVETLLSSIDFIFFSLRIKDRTLVKGFCGLRLCLDIPIPIM